MEIGDVDVVVERLEGLLGEDSVSEAYVRLRIGVYRAQAAVLTALTKGGEAKAPGSLVRQGEPLDVGSMPVNFPLLRHLFDSIAAVLRENGDPGADLTRIESAVAERPGVLGELVRAVAPAGSEENLSDLAGQLGVFPELAVFVARLLAAPLARYEVLRRYGQGDAVSAEGGTCPACGSTPGLASLLPDDGARVLHCSLCGHAWPSGRLDCPFCAGGDPSGLTRLEVSDDDAPWIEACDRCGHYLKVIDRRRLDAQHDFVPLVEDVGGLYLDLVAENEGYLRNAPYVAVG